MKTERRTAPKGPTIIPQISPEKKLLLAPGFLVAAIVLLAAIIITYSNHFHNPFHFDDSHTIEHNSAIRSLKNIPQFFTDASTSSTLPANQAWRPGVTTLNAIDTWLSGGIPDPVWFHRSIFAGFLVLGVLLFFFFLHIFKKAFPGSTHVHWAALIGTGWFMLHTANAETINYIIARADSFSTMMILLAFVMYFYSEKMRRTFLFILPIFIGFFVKEPTIMFAPLLLVFFWLFGEPDKKRERAIWSVGIAFVLAGILYLLSRAMTPPHWTSGGGKWYWYLATEAFVIVHYFFNFIIPVNLSADTDWGLVNSFFDDRVLIGTLFICTLLFLAWKFSKRQETKPISFGILWFFIALIPTSTIFSFSEVLNDHRTFFPYIGLVLAFVTGGMILLQKAIASGKSSVTKPVLVIFSVLLLGVHAIGTHHRNDVWHTGETLWKDVTEKSPGNGRGWMNYGLALMNRPGNPDMNGAIACFDKALSIYPNYSYAHINMGLAQSRIGNDAGAEQHYIQALHDDTLNPECYFYYGLFLLKQQRVNEAVNILNKGHILSPQHDGINQTLSSLQNGNFKSNIQVAQEAVKQNPTPENYVNLSLQFYNNGMFLESAVAAKEAARIKPDYNLAWNNICAAYNKIGEWDSAVAAGEKAVQLKPDDELSKNNYTYAYQQRIKFAKLEADAKKQKNENNWLTLSLEWDKVGNPRKSMIAAEEATMLNPNDPVGWNNVCAAANKLGDWDRAIVAGEKAVQLNPNFELAKNNLAEAKKGKNGQR